MVLSIILPVIVLVLSFSLKMFIDRQTTAHDAISSALELPVDIIFLSISLIVGFILVPRADTLTGFVWFCAYLILAIVIVFIWRRSTNMHINNGKYIGLGFLNYLLSISSLYFSIKLLTGGM
ncbi:MULTISPECIES: hypothetical protein [Acinetobacter calcoaceticus/baumannii complex]|uniref:hypothetical protein n=1 Tax=Acinetobacter calcoaceticus/baumannii complex TaxID=909768 RepID=UPI000E5A121C|nr:MULTISPECIES: hypothetical protein [Acinetobacter calcoaceticus/baumannii complex]QMS82467.1 hypothetical protein GWK28_11130 [Acinetobacter baumannii]GLG82262.1 hypothetical protein ACSO1_07840 [Acinetobacter calcoaceticus]HEP1386095.1 hypothetical protein [Acinetobacter baumannii]